KAGAPCGVGSGPFPRAVPRPSGRRAHAAPPASSPPARKTCVGPSYQSLHLGFLEIRVVEVIRQRHVFLPRYPLIPTDIIHDMQAQTLEVMEASLAGMAMRSVQALQQASTIAS